MRNDKPRLPLVREARAHVQALLKLSNNGITGFPKCCISAHFRPQQFDCGCPCHAALRWLNDSRIIAYLRTA